MSATLKFGGVDGDTEINGCEMNGQFTDIIWLAYGLEAGQVPPFAVFPLVGLPCDDYDVPQEPEAVVLDADCEVVVP